MGPAPPVPDVKKLQVVERLAEAAPRRAASRADAPGQMPHEMTAGTSLVNFFAARLSSSSSQTSQYGTPASIHAFSRVGSVRCWNGPAVWTTNDRPATALSRLAASSRSSRTNFMSSTPFAPSLFAAASKTPAYFADGELGRHIGLRKFFDPTHRRRADAAAAAYDGLVLVVRKASTVRQRSEA